MNESSRKATNGVKKYDFVFVIISPFSVSAWLWILDFRKAHAVGFMSRPICPSMSGWGALGVSDI